MNKGMHIKYVCEQYKVFTCISQCYEYKVLIKILHFNLIGWWVDVTNTVLLPLVNIYLAHDVIQWLPR